MRMPLLALLAKEPAHGYELKLLLEQVFGEAYPTPNIGQIYVTLQRLERDGLVRSEDVVQTRRLSAGSTPLAKALGFVTSSS
jgi:DNA-binding PadR family transcriptional regulator